MSMEDIGIARKLAVYLINCFQVFKQELDNSYKKVNRKV